MLKILVKKRKMQETIIAKKNINLPVSFIKYIIIIIQRYD